MEETRPSPVSNCPHGKYLCAQSAIDHFEDLSFREPSQFPISMNSVGLPNMDVLTTAEEINHIYRVPVDAIEGCLPLDQTISRQLLFCRIVYEVLETISLFDAAEAGYKADVR
jgi:hypothetical protein